MEKKLLPALPCALIFTLLLFSCSSEQFKDVESLNAHLKNKENGYFQEIVRQNFKVQLIARPTDLLVAQEVRNPQTDTVQINQLRKKYRDYRYFVLSISAHERAALQASGSMAAFSENLNQLAFRMGQHVNMTTSAKDTIPVADYHFPRLYGAGGATQMLFAFHKAEMMGTEWVQFNLQDFGMGFGNTVFRFDTKKILQEPKINFIQ